MNFRAVARWTHLAVLLMVAVAEIDDWEQRIHSAKMDLWSRGAFAVNGEAQCAPSRVGPVRKVRRSYIDEKACLDYDCENVWGKIAKFRGGGSGEVLETNLAQLGAKFGPDFVAAIEQNKREHAEDCRISCESFFCATDDSLIWNDAEASFTSYSFGATPPEDFADEFGFPLDLIHVTQGKPLFSAAEAAQVVADAEAEGVHLNEFPSGKYKLGGDWLLNLPKTRQWFNKRLESIFFPLISKLFPEIVSSPSVLRAHSVSLLKYNSTHPRTDVHIDNGILALTVAMTPSDQYVGGGTFFEHMGADNVLAMDVGHGTFRPGSVRHGGHRVTKGSRYILGAFLLIEDRVEHVRRLKNRGSKLRREGNLEAAAQHFEWALAINPKCTTCLKDLSEVLFTQKKFKEAEEMIRKVLFYLENLDSDALFSLGLILSEQGRDDESIEAYQKSVELNAEDAELCYNLGVKLGHRGDTKGEMTMYARATSIDPKMGAAWVNWGSALAASGNLDDGEVMFLKALTCPDVAHKAKINLAMVYNARANGLARQGKLEEAKNTAQQAAAHLDEAKPIMDAMLAMGATNDEDLGSYSEQLLVIRLQCHRLMGSILAGLKDMPACEAEIRKATENFPDNAGAWEMLGKVLRIQGKTEEFAKVQEKVAALVGKR